MSTESDMSDKQERMRAPKGSCRWRMLQVTRMTPEEYAKLRGRPHTKSKAHFPCADKMGCQSHNTHSEISVETTDMEASVNPISNEDLVQRIAETLLAGMHIRDTAIKAAEAMVRQANNNS